MSGGRATSLARLGNRVAGAALAIALASTGGCGVADDPPALRLVLLLSVDTLRADRLAAHGGRDGLAPALDRLSEESVVFTRAYTPVAHTLPAVTALLTGRYPQDLGVTGNLSRLPAETDGIASAFQRAGWNTAAVVSNWVLRGDVGTERGFDAFDDRMTESEAARPMPERDAPGTTRDALAAAARCLPDASSRCFLWVHYQDPHGPYTPPKALRRQRLEVEERRPGGRRELPLLAGSFGPGGIPDYQLVDGRRDVAFYRAGYDAEVMHLDAAIADLLSALEEQVSREQSAILFTSDHGEALGEDDFWFGHGESLEQHQVHVPLWFRVPGQNPGHRDDVASLLDVYPTLASLVLGVRPAQPGGRVLLGPDAEPTPSPILLATLQGSSDHRIGVIEGDWKYLATAAEDRDWDGRLTQIADEGLDLTAAAPQVAARMRARLEELLRDHRAEAGETQSLDATARERLRALGYLREGGE